MTTRPRWGDDEDEDVVELLPNKEERGPDENGIKTTVEYFRNDKGEAVKRTTKVKVVAVQQKAYMVSEERSKWKKFGAAASGNEGITNKALDEFPFESTRKQKQSLQEKKVTDLKDALKGADNQTIVGSLKDMLYKRRMERELRRARGLLEDPELPPGEDDPSGAPSLKPGSYVPPNQRAGRAGVAPPEAPRRYNDNSVRVTNLAEEVTEGDLHELFAPFGAISRVFLALDRETGRSRGFAFINYVRREDGVRAIKALDGHGYANLILHVEWATPREPRR